MQKGHCIVENNWAMESNFQICKFLHWDEHHAAPQSGFSTLLHSMEDFLRVLENKSWKEVQGGDLGFFF